MTTIVNGTSGDDPNLGGPDDNLIIYGYGGNDTIFGNNDAAYSDTIYGGSGDDLIFDAHGPDVVNGGAGNDTIRPGGESDLFRGNGGIDTFAAYDSGGDWLIDLITGLATTSDAPGDVDTLRGIEVIQTGFGADSIAGSPAAETIESGSSDDTINGRGGNDSLDGGGFSDLLMGKAGNDTLYGGDDSFSDTLQGGTGDDSLNGGSGNDVLLGGSGNDTLNDGTSYDDVLNGGKGFDVADYSDAANGLYVDLGAGTAWRVGTGEMDTLHSIEAVLGGSGSDTILGKANANSMTGIGGDDTLIGRGGNDTLQGGPGNDSLEGDNGADRLYGGNGQDVLDGGAGRDLLVGGQGRDFLTGGDGNDRFDYNSLTDSKVGTHGRDKITDFVHGEDRIDVSGIDAIAGGSDDGFTFIGDSALPGGGSAGQLHTVHTASATIVEGDVNGDGVADFQIALAGNLTLTPDDFVL